MPPLDVRPISNLGIVDTGLHRFVAWPSSHATVELLIHALIVDPSGTEEGVHPVAESGLFNERCSLLRRRNWRYRHKHPGGRWSGKIINDEKKQVLVEGQGLNYVQAPNHCINIVMARV